MSGEATGPEGDSSDWMGEFLPEDNLFELGAFLGMLLPSKRHNFHFEERTHQRFGSVAPDLGLRFAFFPSKYGGGELEGALMPSSTKDDSVSATLWGLRVHAVGQLPFWRITPFALFGLGRMGSMSDSLGSDGDPAMHFGVGAKLAIDKMLSVRFDVRDNLTQKNEASEGALTHHPELLLGITFTLGRSAKSEPVGAEPPPSYDTLPAPGGGYPPPGSPGALPPSGGPPPGAPGPAPGPGAPPPGAAPPPGPPPVQ